MPEVNGSELIVICTSHFSLGYNQLTGFILLLQDFDPFSLTFDSDDKEKLRGRGTTDCLGHVALVTQLMRRLGEVKPALKHCHSGVHCQRGELIGHWHWC